MYSVESVNCGMYSVESVNCKMYSVESKLWNAVLVKSFKKTVLKILDFG